MVGYNVKTLHSATQYIQGIMKYLSVTTSFKQVLFKNVRATATQISIWIEHIFNHHWNIIPDDYDHFCRNQDFNHLQFQLHTKLDSDFYIYNHIWDFTVTQSKA